MRTSAAGSSRGPGGFTLVELIVVLAVVSLVAAFAVPALAGRFTRRPVPDAARAFTGLVTEARVRAASTGRPAAVVWLPRSRRLTLVEIAAGQGDGGRRSVAAVPDGVDVTADGLAPVRGIGAGGEDARGAVLFPGGGSTGGAVVFRSAEGSAIRVSVDPLTGYAREEAR
jgi:type II secretion system protein H